MNITPQAPEHREERPAGAQSYRLIEIAHRTPRTPRDAARRALAFPIATATLITLAIGTSASAETLPLADLTPPPNACVPTPIQTRLLEWDLFQNPDGNDDLVVGALAVDDQSSSRNSKLWFATRAGNTRIYRFTPGKGMKKDKAEAKSWDLGSVQTGGLRLRHSSDGRHAFVNVNRDDVNGAVISIDTKDSMRVAWVDRPQSFEQPISDVSVDTRGSHSIFTAALAYYRQDQNSPTDLDGGNGVVQRLRPSQPQYQNGKWVVSAEATRWLVGNGAGSCTDAPAGAIGQCIPGITFDRRRGYPIYFSAPEFPSSAGAIGLLDPAPVKCTSSDASNGCAKVRYFPLPANDQMGMPVDGPRQILVDDNGKLWGITTSGHLFSLVVDRYYDKAVFTIHNPNTFSIEDLFAVSPDGGVIGFTDSGADSEVSVLFPDKFEKPVTAVPDVVARVTRTLKGVREMANMAVYFVDPRDVTASGFEYRNDRDGTYVETNTASGTGSGFESPSANPTGMAPDGARKTGSFFYGVSNSSNPDVPGVITNRVGHFAVNIEPEKELEHRKDDDDFDDDGVDDKDDADDDDDGRFDNEDDDDDNDCIPDVMDKDKDNDGVEDEFDSPSHRENKRTDRGTMAPGQWKEYEMTSDANSVLMLAVVEAATATTPLSIEIVDPNGVVVLSTPPALGKAVATATPALAGVYTVRVKNAGTTSTTYKTTLVGKQIWF